MNNLVLSGVKKLFHLSPDLVQSQLFDETTFYKRFIADLKRSRTEVIIESPFITSQRVFHLTAVFAELVRRKVKVYVITRDPDDHDPNLKRQAECEIRQFETMGIQVLISNEYSHRKLAIIDRKVLWEGSLNILSQTCSREIMRRIQSSSMSQEMFEYLKLSRFIY
ncbi:MAG TPA: phospholipase D-like domain-containing protein [Patescibacteria group bacterium]|nr:phospholipase D-like domain-containing protein [Patescibacteria group bacterium]